MVAERGAAGCFRFQHQVETPIFDDVWYDTVSASPLTAKIAARFIREMLGFDRGNYGSDFAERLDRLAPNRTVAYVDAAHQMVGDSFDANTAAAAAGAVRHLSGFQGVVQAALDDPASIHRQHARRGRDHLRSALLVNTVISTL